MEWLLGVLAFIFLCLAGFFLWRSLFLHCILSKYETTLRNLSDTEPPFHELPPFVKGLEELSSSVYQLVDTYKDYSSTIEGERDKLASILEQLTDGVLIVDAKGVVTFMNPAAKHMFDVPVADSYRVTEVLRQNHLIEAWQFSQQTRTAQSETAELMANRQFLQLFILPDKQSGGTLLLAQDLTRVHRLETMRRDFISNLSHELRTPLASLKALTETLRDGALDDPTVASRFLGRIEIEVDALIQMAQELLDLSRIESGKSLLDFSNVDAKELIGSSIERMRTQAERAGLTLKTTIPDNLPVIRADASRLEQVFVNLIHNAIKFTNPGGEVILSADANEDSIRFSIKDTGVGIPEEDLERIFERFYKADRARSGGGTGLGLSIARHIVEAHGGSIWAESLERKGSVFHFTIPRGK